MSATPPFAALPTAPGLARGHVRATLAEWGLSEFADTAELVASEMTANAVNASAPVQAAGTVLVIRLCLVTHGHVLSVECWDQAPGMPVLQEAPGFAETGRGLAIIDSLTGGAWGCRPAIGQTGKCVWAEIALRDQPASPFPALAPLSGTADLTRPHAGINRTGASLAKQAVQRTGGHHTGGLVQRALVTGAAGFIGSHLAADLLRQGWHVTGLDTRGASSDPVAAENLAVLTSHPRFRMARADLTSADLTVPVEGVQVAFHLAGLPGARRSWGDQFPGYLTVNVLGTQRLLEACAAAEVPRLVFASSSSVYGPGNGTPSRETDQPLPLSPYGVSKLAAERLCLAYANRPSAVTSVVALRYFTVYGPRQRPDMAFTRIMRAALSGRAVPLYGSGAQRRDFTHVSDAVAATISAASCEARAEVVNVASGRSVPLVQAVRRIASLAGAEVPSLRRAAQPGDADVTAADLARARDLLGYEPRVDLADGLRTQWEWLSAQEHPGQPVAVEAAL